MAVSEYYLCCKIANKIFPLQKSRTWYTPGGGGTATWWSVSGSVSSFVDDCEGEGTLPFLFIPRGPNSRSDASAAMAASSSFRAVRALVLKESLEFTENSDLVIVAWKSASLSDSLVKMISGGSLRPLGRLVEWACPFNSGLSWWLRLECSNWGMGITVTYLVAEWISSSDSEW